MTKVHAKRKKRKKRKKIMKLPVDPFARRIDLAMRKQLAERIQVAKYLADFISEYGPRDEFLAALANVETLQSYADANDHSYDDLITGLGALSVSVRCLEF